MRPKNPENNPVIRFKPTVAAKLSEAAKESLARKQEQQNLPGGQSVGHGHKPTQASGRQGPRERKVRW